MPIALLTRPSLLLDNSQYILSDPWNVLFAMIPVPIHVKYFYHVSEYHFPFIEFIYEMCFLRKKVMEKLKQDIKNLITSFMF